MTKAPGSEDLFSDAKYRLGDSVTIVGKIVDMEYIQYPTLGYYIEVGTRWHCEQQPFLISEEHIVSGVSRPIEIGDKVYFKESTLTVYTVLAIHNDMVWTEFNSDPKKSNGAYFIAPVKEFKRV